MHPRRSSLTLLGCVLAVAGCTGFPARLVVTQSAPERGPVGVAAVPGGPERPESELRGRVYGPGAGLLRDHAGRASARAPQADLLGPGRALQAVAGAHVSLVGLFGEAIATAPLVTDAAGAYVFKNVGALPAVVFVRVAYEQDGRPVVLYTPVKLPQPGESREVDVGPATTLVAKKLKAMALDRQVDLTRLDAASLVRSAELLAPAMSDQAVAMALLLSEDRAGRLLDTMLKDRPALNDALLGLWRPDDFIFRATPQKASGSSARATPAPVLYSIWDTATRPSVSNAADGAAGGGVTLGLKFRAKVDGSLVGLRFYKDAANTGPHVANLWSLDGTLLATAAFTTETPSGWQQANFASPVPLSAGTTYVASYHTTNGAYAFDDQYFASGGADTSRLQAPAAAVVEGNAVYAYGAAGTYPLNVSPDNRNYWVDVVFSAPSSGPDPGATSLWSQTHLPGVAGYADTSANELGVKFRSDVAGLITGLKFYKHAANTGTHVGTLWAADGTRLASADFTGESGSGWQTVSFARPVAIAPNTTYVASYFAPMGRYAADWYAFNGLDRRNGPLLAPSDGTDGPNGVYDAGGMTFPASNNGKQTNYWVDVDFVRAAPPAAPPTTSLWNLAAAPPAGQDDAGDPQDYELGVTFKPSASGQVTGVRFYKSPGNVGMHVANLWDAASPGAPIATAAFTAETASGWQEVAFASPVAVSAGTTYVASYTCPSGHYAATGRYFATPMDTGLLQAPAAAGIFNATPGAFPVSAFNNANYWVEPVFRP